MDRSFRETDQHGDPLLDAAAVREQLERMLASPRFQHSRRFPAFLRFVVDHALHAEDAQVDAQIKERTLGIEIFGRNADYDTATDPIVRVTAAEIRKRIAQYYAEPEHGEEPRLLLPAGSYLPQFRSAHPLQSEPGGQLQRTRSSRRRLLIEILAAVLIFAAGLAAGWLMRVH